MVVTRFAPTASGELQLEKACVRWLLSIDKKTLPEPYKVKNTCRLFKIDDREIELSDGFRDLHTESYKQILEGNGFGIQDCYPSLKLVDELRKSV